MASFDRPSDKRRRVRMVRDQLYGYSQRICGLMQRVPRHHFVPAVARADAYADSPLAIGAGQTISQPRMVAAMLDELDLRLGQQVLDCGSGSGYAACLLAHLVGPTGLVHGVERQAVLLEQSRAPLGELTGSDEAAPVCLHLADGAMGLPEHAPFDRIHVACACPGIPDSLIEQLAPGGRMVLPVGPDGGDQRLWLVTRDPGGRVHRAPLMAVSFVPLREGVVALARTAETAEAS